jgi:hypothetical protein
LQGFEELLLWSRVVLLSMTVLLRRTKGSKIGGQPIIALPERRQQLLKIEFSRDESAFYKQVMVWRGFD